MSNLEHMPRGGFVVIVIIGILFVLAVILLFHVFLRYKVLAGKASGDDQKAKGFKAALLGVYIDSYKKFGQDVNTPAIISDLISSRLSGLLLCERFLNNAVSLFVTLGLFGTFLGLSMAVSSLTKLIGYSAPEQWLSVLDSVGGGLMSALGGMGVAFYTSLAGAGCSIALTVLRTIFNPQAERERLESRLEMWLDNEIAPTLKTELPKDDADLVARLVDGMKEAAEDVRQTLYNAGEAYVASTRASAVSFAKSMDTGRDAIAAFDKTVATFNNGVHDFSEVDYNLRGSVERMDLAVRDLSSALREINRRLQGGQQ
jgi:hypothetical protein